MIKFPAYWSDKLKIDYLQRVILVNSYLYYECNTNKLSDRAYDNISKQLVELQSKHIKPWIRSKTQYGYVFYNYDGSTGFDLYDRLNVQDKAYIRQLAL